MHPPWTDASWCKTHSTLQSTTRNISQPMIPITLYFSPEVPLITELQRKHIVAPPSLNDTFAKLKDLEKQANDSLHEMKTAKEEIHHMAYIPNGAAMTTRYQAAQLRQACSAWDTFISLWITVATPHWNAFNPVYWIRNGLSSLQQIWTFVKELFILAILLLLFLVFKLKNMIFPPKRKKIYD